jgi:hypothetical protein
MERATPEGATLRWRLTTGAYGGGALPFLIAWGDTPHPAESAPSGLRLLDIRIEHPDAATIAAQLAALDVDVPVAVAQHARLVATIGGPAGTVEIG